MSVRWRSDFSKSVVVDNFVRRGWVEASADDDDLDWDIYWASVGTVKQIFGADSTLRLQPGQLVNHFPNHYELTRKDLMVKNIKRYQKQQRKEGADPQTTDFIPLTYVLPQEHALFVEGFRRLASATWIIKPSARSQGKGIFLVNKLSQVKRWSGASLVPPALRGQHQHQHQVESHVVSQYIDNPLLVGGKKFDLRLYVVVTAFKPLTVYMSSLGFARFCNVKYSSEVAELDNEYVHLTNVAIQQTGEDYNEHHGNKWPLANLRLYLEGTCGTEAVDKLFADIESVVVQSLLACQGVIINDRHCFELYGYDMLIDANFKPWLIEVNASPSLTTTTESDRLLKFKVVNDTINAVTPPEWLPFTHRTVLTAGMLHECDEPASRLLLSRSTPRPQVGSLRLIYSEAQGGPRQAGAAAQHAAAPVAAAAGAGVSKAAGGAGGSSSRGGSAASSRHHSSGPARSSGSTAAALGPSHGKPAGSRRPLSAV